MISRTLRSFALFVIACGLSAGGAVAQSTVAMPGSRQPAAPPKPRIAPLPESQWTDVHKQLVAKYLQGGAADNAFKTLLQLPELVDGVMPYTNYLSGESTLSPR